MFSTILQARTIGARGEEVGSEFAQKIAGFFDYIFSQIPSWIAGFVVFVLTIFIAKMAKSAVEARISDQIDEEHQGVLVLAGRVTYFGTLTVGITVALKIAGIDLTTILAAVAFGIGFALQDLIMNFIAGVLILVSRQISIGDFIKVGDTVGKVTEIQTRATVLKSIDGTKVIVPNSEIFTSQVVNFTANPLRRVVIPLYVAYGTDLSYAMKVGLDVLKKHPKIQKKPGPSVVVSNYGDSSVDLSARFWVGSRDGWYKVKCDIMQQMLEAFDESGIVVPYNVTHIETGADTAEEWKRAGETAAKLSKAMHEEKTPVASTGANGNGQGKVAVTPAAPTAATVPVEPEAAYQDQVEIDGQA